MIILIACSKTKGPRPVAAGSLYTGPLYRLRVEYAARTPSPEPTYTMILSAKHHVLHPYTVIDPYDLTLGQLGAAGRRSWSLQVWSQLRELLTPGESLTVLAGADYYRGWRPLAQRAGHDVRVPFEGQPVGIRRRNLSEAVRMHDPTIPDAPPGALVHSPPGPETDQKGRTT